MTFCSFFQDFCQFGLYKKLDLQEGGEKREKNVLESEFLLFPFSIFFSFSPVSFTSIFFFTYNFPRIKLLLKF